VPLGKVVSRVSPQTIACAEGPWWIIARSLEWNNIRAIQWCALRKKLPLQVKRFHLCLKSCMFISTLAPVAQSGSCITVRRLISTDQPFNRSLPSLCKNRWLALMNQINVNPLSVAAKMPLFSLNPSETVLRAFKSTWAFTVLHS